jgi:hypothetical protein
MAADFRPLRIAIFERVVPAAGGKPYFRPNGHGPNEHEVSM